MNRFCLTAVLGLVSVCLVGCGQSGGGTIYAAAPGGNFRSSYVAGSGGHYTLFHVTKWDINGEPLDSQQIASYDLQPGDKVGFTWMTDRAKMYDPDAQANLQAYAGDHRLNLGGLGSPNERYFWADAGGWNAYWSGQPMRTIGNAATLQ